MGRWIRLCLSAMAGLALLTAPAASQQHGLWRRAESPGFIVYADATEPRVRALVQDLETFDALLRRMTEAPAERSATRLEVYVFRGVGPFSEAFPGMNSTVRGVYSADIDIIASYAIFRDTYGLDAQEILFHEYAHHFMYQYFANAYPAWYIEGFAEFVQTAAFEENRIVLGRSSESRASWLFAGSWLPMRRLLTRDLDDGEDVARFYAQSWLFTHYLFTTPGKMAQFRAYVRAVRLGGDPVESFAPAFGVTPDEMQSELRRYLRNNPPALALTQPAVVTHAAVMVTPMPRSADELLPISTRVRRGVEGESGAEALERIRELVGLNPEDRFALITLARAEAMLGDIGRARLLLEPHIEANINDVEALYLLGFTYVRQARDAKDEGRTTERNELYAQARRYFVRAHRIDENHVPTLYRYAETFSGVAQSRAASENRLNIMLLARQLAPQVQEINLNAANLLMAHGRAAEAVPILRMVAYDPHAGSGAETARTLLGEAEAAASATASTAP